MVVNTRFSDLGLIEYGAAWALQERLFNYIIEQKKAGLAETENFLLFCEHPHVYTLGKSGSDSNLLIDAIQLKAKEASFFRTNRGGDITYHGPGQLVGYPIFNLEPLVSGAREYIEKLEEAIILTLQPYGVYGERMKGATGVWLDIDQPGKTRKICAIGVRTSHWVSMHGFALNINTNLQYFNFIHPCGFTDKSVTSLAAELGQEVDIHEVKTTLLSKLAFVFNLKPDVVSIAELNQKINK
ncbi:MAG: lipoyl(octanoyl) transferase LipB [Lentimicrobiaceae bacterium]|nr:lipoyl(octanoyl) transferase LipB [Lentimicrobiaceae bacterium]MCO5264831.1 lipoyl(octanoyl) transferase LipB [Lentimicrobium sp.]HPG34134.1 lipoyl(octanoyl) transferase LipB [Lentimicrobium sp.]